MNFWPFTNYASQIDWTPDIRISAMSKKHSARRQTKLDSDDPKVRQQAIGDMGPLSGIKTNTKLAKNSFVG